MPISDVKDIARYAGQEATVRGWLRHKRVGGKIAFLVVRDGTGDIQAVVRDRKSTRLNSSHGYISYAVFCLKKKKTTKQRPSLRSIQRHDRIVRQLSHTTLNSYA